MHIAQINYAYDKHVNDPDALLDRYSTLTGWSRALVSAGVDGVTVVQQFSRDATVTRGGVEYLFRARSLQSAASAVNPDLVHVNGLSFPVRTWVLRQRLPARTAIVLQDHASGDPDRGLTADELSIRRVIRRAGMRSADAFFFTAAPQAEPWRRAGLIAEHQHIYQVMESSTTLLPLPREEARQASGIDGEPAVLWVGRLNANKDPLTVLDGFEQSVAYLPRATLTMVFGAGDLRSAVEARVRSSEALTGRVRLVGQVPHTTMPAFYSAADLFVLGSHHEGSGYALIEACACGTIPVVTNIPTFRVITADGAVGGLWRIEDARDLARRLVDIGHSDLAARRARLLDHFDRLLSWHALGRRATASYEDVLSGRTWRREFSSSNSN